MSSRSRTAIACSALALTTIMVANPLSVRAQGIPGLDPNKCLAGKTKCVNKKLAGLLKCREKCQKSPAKCGQPQTDCEVKVMAKFDGGPNPAKGCFAKLEAKDVPGASPDKVCTTTGDTAAMETLADAVVDDLLATLEGTPPSGACGVCGNGVAEGEESCDGVDLAGVDCTAFGFNGSAGLACTPDCEFNLSACETNVDVPATYGFRNNGDGTVTDRWTGLMWEVKTSSGAPTTNCPDLATCPDPHEVNYRYTWSATGTAFDGSAKTAFLDVLNDVAGGGASCFAGYCDWRLPSLPELKGILLEPESAGGCSASPCLDASFPGFAASNDYWSSTGLGPLEPTNALFVRFTSGGVGFAGKNGFHHVRAMRGGL